VQDGLVYSNSPFDSCRVAPDSKKMLLYLCWETEHVEGNCVTGIRELLSKETFQMFVFKFVLWLPFVLVQWHLPNSIESVRE
jgi:hypothetical protein